MTAKATSLVDQVVRALLHRGVPEAFARYMEAAECLTAASDTGDRAELEDVDRLDSPRVLRAQRLADRFRADLAAARADMDRLLGEDALRRHRAPSVRAGNWRPLGVALRAATERTLAQAWPLVDAERSRGVELAPPHARDDDAAAEPDPIPDPRLEKKECSCGRRVRAYLFSEHTRTCAAVDRSPIPDRDQEEPEEDHVPKKIDCPPERVAALVAAGKSTREVAASLGVSKASVQRRLKTLGVSPEERAAPPVAPPRVERTSFRVETRSTFRVPAIQESSDSLEVLRACVALLEPLPEHDRRAVAYFLGHRYSAPRGA